MGKDLADIAGHQHDWNGVRQPRQGSWSSRGDGTYSRATWSDVHCTCGHLMGQGDHGMDTK